jgi:hypothetical protein
MDKLLEILNQHKDIVSYTISFSKPQILTIKFKDGSTLRLCEVQLDKTKKNNETTNI